MTDRILPFDRAVISQNTGYWCGPATVQNILSSRMKVDESVLAREMGTDSNGTAWVGLLRDALKRRLPQANYRAVVLDNDPPTTAQKDTLWRDIVRSIDNGYGVAMNWVSPPGNKPRGVKGSPTPRYSGGTTFHYVAAMGWSDEGNSGKSSVFIVDSGFWPGAYWVDFDQCASLIPPKGYAFAALPLPTSAGVVVPPPQPPVVIAPKPTEAAALIDPKTVTMLTRNSYRPRNMPSPLWIFTHTSESRSRVRDLQNYCDTHGVSYHRLVDDIDILEGVLDMDAPWSAAGANKYAYHICWSSSFAGWSREQWLDPNPTDGFNERQALRNGAKQIAHWIAKSDAVDHRPIPAVWIGGRARPPWGLSGICGHVDGGAWAGGHTDPGVNFPVQTLMADIAQFLTGQEQPPLVPLPPVQVPGTDPSAYADWLLYQGNPGNDTTRVSSVQDRLKRAYATYGGHLKVDGVFGALTKAAVMEFQRRSGMIADGIVGPMTASALKP